MASHADQALAAYATIGLRPLRPDGVLGGDGRVDLYLRDLQQSDGSSGLDGCTETPVHCTGHVIMENDFAGFSYPSPSLGIRVLVSHELFHGVQDACDADQPIAWTEGTAVWAEERVFPEQGDFEGLVAAFLARPARPFDRAGAGFGDRYPYGAALWPYFLEHRFGVEVIPEIWANCEASADHRPDFLDATERVLAARGSSLRAAWIEFSRWNAETGCLLATCRSSSPDRRGWW